MSSAQELVEAAMALQAAVVRQGKELVGTFQPPVGDRLFFGQMSAVGDILCIGGGTKLGENDTFVSATPAAAQLMFKIQDPGANAEPRKIGFGLP